MVDADFRSQYGIDGIGEGYIPTHLTGPRFLHMCNALRFSRGAIHGYIENIQNQQDQEKEQQEKTQQYSRERRTSQYEVPAEAAVINKNFKASDRFPDVFEVNKPSKGGG